MRVDSLPPFYVRIQNATEVDRLRDDKSVVALIRSGKHTTIKNQSPMEIVIATSNLANDVVEVWYSRETFTADVLEGVNYRANDSFIFGALLVQEEGFANLVEATQTAYEQIFRTLQHKGYPGLLRMWNFFPEINTVVDDLERYRAFCLGRHRAVSSWKFLTQQLPAATAIGQTGTGLLIYFVAAKQAGVQIENPRQISAFHYPTLYGPRSPSFSRAIIKNWGESQQLFISGTASIVGHETRHNGDPMSQLRETLENIQTVIHQARQSFVIPVSDITDLNVLRVYIRDPESAPQILDRLRKEIGNECGLHSVTGDVCRSDLLLEIEGIFAP